MGSDQADREKAQGEGWMGMGAELLHGALEMGGALGHGVASLPLAGTVIHGGLGAYHAYEMYEKGEEANATEDVNEAARLRAEAQKEGHEAEQNAVEAVPLFGTGYGMASLAYNHQMFGLNPEGSTAAEKVFGDGGGAAPAANDGGGGAGGAPAAANDGGGGAGGAPAAANDGGGGSSMPTGAVDPVAPDEEGGVCQ